MMIGRAAVVAALFLPTTLPAAPIAGCHGKPNGGPDMPGFEKDGIESGDLIGVMSVTIALSD